MKSKPKHNPTAVDISLPRRTRKRVAKLMTEWEGVYGIPLHRTAAPAQRIVEAVMSAGVTWDQVLLALSNLCVHQSNKTGRGRKDWRRRAMLLHRAMEGERTRKVAKREMGAETAEVVGGAK